MTPRSLTTPPDRLLDGGIRPLTDREFARYQQWILLQAGIHLSDAKKALVTGRLLRRLRELGISSFGEYIDHAIEHPDEATILLDSICTNETHFFREPKHFDFLREQVYAQWTRLAAEGRRERRIRVWSAACSTGEEPYSLAMSLLTYFPPDSGWSLEILATDLSTKALAQAEAGLWSVERSKEIPSSLLKTFMLQGVRTQEGLMKAGPLVRSVIRFASVNLSHERYSVQGPFDLIFCRNVLIYFAPETKNSVISRLLDHLTPDGLLFLGHAESLFGMTNRVRSVQPAVYALTSSTLFTGSGQRRTLTPVRKGSSS